MILGDQSVVITKILILILRRRTCGFALFRILVRTWCRGAASASLRACVCSFLREQVRGLVSPRSSSVNSLVGVAAPSDPVGSFYSKNPS